MRLRQQDAIIRNAEARKRAIEREMIGQFCPVKVGGRIDCLQNSIKDKTMQITDVKIVQQQAFTGRPGFSLSGPVLKNDGTPSRTRAWQFLPYEEPTK